ncbi:MAG: ribosome recycling factor [Planctomycetota bacterium]|nr:MAG: ribosome recycling factor [Planctomycetota bacterium]
MTTDPDTILLEAEESMQRAVDYLSSELRGLRAGRASTAMVEFVKCDCYGSPTDLKALAAISVPEPTQILIKPFDPGTIGAIKQGIEAANLGVNPMVEDKSIRIMLPAMSAQRRDQLVSQAKKVGEEQKVVMRNARRDANKAADALKNAQPPVSEDEIKQLHEEIQDLLKRYEAKIDEAVAKKIAEIREI